ncbi:unnamed protein product, partial [Iphiclides podalirius]
MTDLKKRIKKEINNDNKENDFNHVKDKEPLNLNIPLRVLSRIVVISALLLVVYFTSRDEKLETFAKQFEVVKDKIKFTIAHHFGVLPSKIYLTHPTFFSEITSKPPVTLHDQYWHPHVDKETYKSFHYTTLLYLSNYNVDFEGGPDLGEGNRGNSPGASTKEGPHLKTRIGLHSFVAPRPPDL